MLIEVPKAHLSVIGSNQLIVFVIECQRLAARRLELE
jgi:hypothetical protein